MPAQTYAKRARGKTSGRVSYSHDFLGRMVRILVHTGHSPKALLREFREICHGLKEPARKWNPALLAYVSDLPHVITHWHSDPQYLDSRGAPIPLPFRSRGPCLSALIERVLPHENPVEVARSLMRLKGVRRVGARYVPTARHLTYPRVVGRIHGLSALSGMLGTVERNVTSRNKPPLIERAALNPSFPVSALPRFYPRLENQTSKFLWEQDGSMRSLEKEDPNGPRVRLGVVVFTFEEPILDTEPSSSRLHRGGSRFGARRPQRAGRAGRRG